MPNVTLKALIEQHEGRRKTAYRDSKGFLTIGVGICIDPNHPGAGLDDTEIDFLTSHRIGLIESALDARISWWRRLSPDCQDALVDMAFNLGVDGLMKFEKMLSALESGDYNAAADAALDSKWAREDVPNRAKEDAELIRGS